MKPYPTEIPALSLIGPTRPVGESETRTVFISTITGSASVGGNTQQMGNATDSALFLGVRQWSDAVLVGAQTVRAEDYGPSLGTPEDREARLSRGQTAAPVLGVVTLSMQFDTSSRLFSDPEHPPAFLVPDMSLTHPVLAERRRQLEEAGAEIIPTGSGSPADIVAALHARELKRISCEGGPGILGLMFAADLVDVLHLTLEPLAHGPVEQPLVHLVPDAGPFTHRLELEDVQVTADSSVFLRYRRHR